MNIPKLFDYKKFMGKSSSASPTTWGDMFRFFENHGEVTEALVKALLWQPNTQYRVGDGVSSPNLPAGTLARCVTAGTSSATEPAWPAAGSTVTDGTVKWLTENTIKASNDKENNFLQRNTAYSIGDIAYSPNLPSWAYLECTSAGTTGASEPDFSSVKSGGVILDGEAKFTIKTVCAKEYVDTLRAYVDSLRDADKVVEVPITNLVGTDYINEISCQKSGHVVTVQFDVSKVLSANSGTRDSAILKGFPRPCCDMVWVHCFPMQRTVTLRGFLADDYFTWHYCANWQTSHGDECVCTFTYLTND